jgi:hypothetical protein
VNLWIVIWWWSGMEGKKLHKWLWNPSIWTPWLQVTTIILSCIQDAKNKWLNWYLLLCGKWYMVNVKRLILTIHSKRTFRKISRCFERVEDWGIKWEGEWKSGAIKWIGLDIIKNNGWTCHLICSWMVAKFDLWYTYPLHNNGPYIQSRLFMNHLNIVDRCRITWIIDIKQKYF